MQLKVVVKVGIENNTNSLNKENSIFSILFFHICNQWCIFKLMNPNVKAILGHTT